MNPKVQEIADHFGVKLSDRIATSIDRGLPESFQWSGALYDGKSIATRIQHWKLQETSKLDQWGDPLYIEVLTEVEQRADHDLLHEIAHYAVASQEQRELPEFGLGTVAYGLELGQEAEHKEWYRAIPSVVETQEGRIQEFMSELLCVMWGQRFNIDPNFTGWYGTWDEYLVMKIGHALNQTYQCGDDIRYDGIYAMWEALFRLREMKMLTFN